MTARAANHIREAELEPVAFSQAFLDEPLTVALMDAAGHALTRWSPSRFTRPGQERGPAALQVLRDYLLENAPSDAVVAELERTSRSAKYLADLARQVITRSGHAQVHKVKLEACNQYNRHWSLFTILRQVHAFGRTCRMLLDEGQLEAVKGVRADRRKWVRRALAERKVQQEVKRIEREHGGTVTHVRR